ncbi:hypothetical protein MASR2M79_15170 [Aminivibrio sp.]
MRRGGFSFADLAIDLIDQDDGIFYKHSGEAQEAEEAMKSKGLPITSRPNVRPMMQRGRQSR